MSLSNIGSGRFKEKIAKGRLCIGIAILVADPAIGELHGDAGYDFVWIDTEHGPMDLLAALAHVMATRGANAAPFVRVQANDPVRIAVTPVPADHPAARSDGGRRPSLSSVRSSLRAYRQKADKADFATVDAGPA